MQHAPEPVDVERWNLFKYACTTRCRFKGFVLLFVLFFKQELLIKSASAVELGLLLL